MVWNENKALKFTLIIFSKYKPFFLIVPNYKNQFTYEKQTNYSERFKVFSHGWFSPCSLTFALFLPSLFHAFAVPHCVFCVSWLIYFRLIKVAFVCFHGQTDPKSN